MNSPDTDTSALLDGVSAFISKVILPALPHPELRLDISTRRSILTAAAEAGLLPEPGEGMDGGLWGCEAGGASFALPALRLLGRANASLALLLHQQCLAQWGCAALGGDFPAGTPALVLQGHYGLGGPGLAQILAGQAMPDEDADTLTATYALRQPRLLLAADWDWLLLAGCQAGQLGWYRVQRAHCHISPVWPAHSFDDVDTSWVEVVDVEDFLPAPELQGRLLQMDAVGMLAIALGILDTGHALALDYAAQRRQGGRLIAQWPAVQQMLGRQRSTIATVDMVLHGLQDLPLSCTALARVLAQRAELMPRLCGAINDVMQVFGGTGYMRDVGIERLLRDMNGLRVLHGSPLELNLLAHNLEVAA